MSRQKGTPKTGGRAKGTPNKVNAEMKQWISDLLTKNRATFAKRLAMLDAPDFCKTFAGLLNYVMPKQQAVTIEEQTAAEYAALKDLIQTAPDEAVDMIARKVLELQGQNQTGKENE